MSKPVLAWMCTRRARKEVQLSITDTGENCYGWADRHVEGRRQKINQQPRNKKHDAKLQSKTETRLTDTTAETSSELRQREEQQGSTEGTKTTTNRTRT